MGLRDDKRAEVDKEKVDPMPHELMHKAFAPPTLREQIQEGIRSALSLQAETHGYESFEDADDFELDEAEADPLTIYEQVMMEPETDESLDGAPESPPKPSAEDTPTPSTPPEGSAPDDSAPEPSAASPPATGK